MSEDMSEDDLSEAVRMYKLNLYREWRAQHGMDVLSEEELQRTSDRLDAMTEAMFEAFMSPVKKA